MNALEHRLAELDREIAAARGEYERKRARVYEPGYVDEMLQTLARVAEIVNAPHGERPDLQALVMIGRIGEIVGRYSEDLATLDHYDRLKYQRLKIEKGLA